MVNKTVLNDEETIFDDERCEWDRKVVVVEDGERQGGFDLEDLWTVITRHRAVRIVSCSEVLLITGRTLGSFLIEVDLRRRHCRGRSSSDCKSRLSSSIPLREDRISTSIRLQMVPKLTHPAVDDDAFISPGEKENVISLRQKEG
ncbi:hypothetical protein J6590_006734 [Homalodisca vitripennis]|nr:hypothetical protein J6590_006734 [Homalodisca vitripennis]